MGYPTEHSPVEYLERRIIYYKKMIPKAKAAINDDFLIKRYGIRKIKEASKSRVAYYQARIKEYMVAISVLQTSKRYNENKLPTMSIMGKKYLDRFGFIYHPSYKNVYADNEAMEVAIALGKHKFIDKNIYDHFHPVWNMAEWDEQYRQSENVVSYAIDKANYEERKANNFYL